MDFITDILKEVIPLLAGKKPRFLVEFFASHDGSGSGEIIATSEGEHPSVGEFIFRILKNGATSIHRVSKVHYVMRGNDCIPYLIAPTVTPEYYRELSDAFTDFVVIFLNAQGAMVSSLNCKNSLVPDIGTKIIRDKVDYTVVEHCHVAHSQLLKLAVKAVDQRPQKIRKPRKRKA